MKNARQMRALYALFRGLDLGLDVFQDAAFFLHVFLVPKEAQETFEPPLVAFPRRGDHDYYAGTGSIFGGKGERCANCATGKKVDVLVDVTDFLRRDLKLGRRDVVVKALVVDANTDELVVLTAATTAVTGIPLPELVGPWWDAAEQVPALSQDSDASAAAVKDMTRAVQKMLRSWGYYEGTVDAKFGDVTGEAVRMFQDVNKLAPDGVVGPKTLSALKRVRYDGRKDIGDQDAPAFATGQWLKYYVAAAPGYLDRRAVLAEVDAAFAQWADAATLRVERVDDPGDARLTVAWAAPDETSFDGPGGTLAVADAGGITFDYHEEWLLQGMDNKPNAFFLLPVALHEIGHCLGLTHAPLSEYRDVMNPYYVANKVRLSDNDIARAKKATKPTT